MQKRNETYILDTSVLIHNPDVLFTLHNAELVVPAAVIRELDGLKRLPNAYGPRARAARKVTRNLDLLGGQGDISRGVETLAGSVVRISHKYAPVDDLRSLADNRIVGTAVLLSKQAEARVTVLSNDGNVRNIARSYGIGAAAYPFSRKASDATAGKEIETTMPASRHSRNGYGNVQGMWSIREKALQLVIVFIAAVILFVLLRSAG